MSSAARHPALALARRLVPSWCWGVAWGYALAALGSWLAGWPQLVPYFLGLLAIQVVSLVGPRLLRRDAAPRACAACGPAPSESPPAATRPEGRPTPPAGDRHAECSLPREADG